MFREEELEKHKRQCIETNGCSKKHKAIRYAMINNKVSSIWQYICNDGSECKEFLEELEKFHEKIQSRRHGKENTETSIEVHHNDPPVASNEFVMKGKRLKHPSEPNVELKKETYKVKK
jgi:hypothetical protein